MAIRVALRVPSDACHSLLPRLLKCTSSRLRLSLSLSLPRSLCALLCSTPLPFLRPFFLLLATESAVLSAIYSLHPGPREERQNPWARACDAAVRQTVEKRRENYYRLHFPSAFSSSFGPPLRPLAPSPRSSYIVKDTFNLSSSLRAFRQTCPGTIKESLFCID